MLLRCESLEPPMSEVGQSRSSGDVASMSELPSKAVAERTSVHAAKVPIPDSYSAASRTLRRSRFVMQAIDVCWWRCRCRPDEVARIAEPVGKEGRLHHAAQAGAQPPKGAIDIAIVLPFEVLQDFLPRPGRAADQ